jgi:hypothetical protein
LCYVKEASAWCSECAKSNVKCDGTWSDAEWEALQESKRKLKAELVATRAAVKAGLDKTTRLEEQLDGISRREDLMVSREEANLLLDFPAVAESVGAADGSDPAISCP